MHTVSGALHYSVTTTSSFNSHSQIYALFPLLDSCSKIIDDDLVPSTTQSHLPDRPLRNSAARWRLYSE